MCDEPILHPYLCNCGRLRLPQCLKTVHKLHPNLLPRTTAVENTKQARFLRHITHYGPSSEQSQRVTRTSRLPLSLLAARHGATLTIQSAWRRFSAKQKSNYRRWMLNELFHVTRRFFWRLQMRRLDRCFRAWTLWSSGPKQVDAVLCIQKNARKYLAFRRFSAWKKGKGLVFHILRSRLQSCAFCQWKYFCRTAAETQLLDQVLNRWCTFTYHQRRLRSTLEWLWDEKIQAEKMRCILTWRKYTMWRNNQEKRFRQTIVWKRWRKLTEVERSSKRKFIRKCFSYWHCWTRLALRRMEIQRGSIRIQSIWRGFNFRYCRFRAATVIQCVSRRFFAKRERERRKIFLLFKNGFRAWKRCAPEWKVKRIKRRKRRKWRQVVRRRAERRARGGEGAPPSWEVLLQKMELILSHGINVADKE